MNKGLAVFQGIVSYYYVWANGSCHFMICSNVTRCLKGNAYEKETDANACIFHVLGI